MTLEPSNPATATAGPMNPFHENGKPIPGTEGLTLQAILTEIQKGGRFASPMYCVSIILLTFRRSLGMRFYRADQSGAGRAFLGTFITTIVGWWGIPWGPIYSIGAIVSNLRGGKDLTKEVLGATIGEPQAQALLQSRTKPRAGLGLWLLRALVIGPPLFMIINSIFLFKMVAQDREERLANDPGFAAYKEASDQLQSSTRSGNTPAARQAASATKALLDTMVSASLEDTKRKARPTHVYFHFTEDKAIVLASLPDLRRFSDDAKSDILDSVWRMGHAGASQHLPEGSELIVAVQGMALWEGALVGKTGDRDAEDAPKPTRRVSGTTATDDELERAFTPRSSPDNP